MARWRTFGLAVVAAALAGCALPSASDSPTPTTTPGPSASAGPLFADDFASPSSGWPVVATAGYSTAYVRTPAGPAYQITVRDSTIVLAPAPVTTLPAGLRVAVDIAETGLGRDSHLGVDCRYGQTDYLLQVGNGGYFGILKLSGGTLLSDLVDSLSQGPSSAVKDPPAVNHIGVVCDPRAGGMTLSLTVNGALVATAHDSGPPFGSKVELVLRDAPGSHPSQALFSHLVVTPVGPVSASATSTPGTTG